MGDALTRSALSRRVVHSLTDVTEVSRSCGPRRPLGNSERLLQLYTLEETNHRTSSYPQQLHIQGRVAMRCVCTTTKGQHDVLYDLTTKMVEVAKHTLADAMHHSSSKTKAWFFLWKRCNRASSRRDIRPTWSLWPCGA